MVTSPSESAALSEDAREAVEVAKAAEKAEARRTTRLAAGKIKQVDYNAAPVLPKARSLDSEPEVTTNKKGSVSGNKTDGMSLSNGSGEIGRRSRATRATRSKTQEEDKKKEGSDGKRNSNKGSVGNGSGEEGQNKEQSLGSTRGKSLEESKDKGEITFSGIVNEFGWDAVSIDCLGKAIATVKLLEVSKIYDELENYPEWSRQEKSEQDVTEYINAMKKKIRKVASASFGKDVKYTSILAFLANEKYNFGDTKKHRKGRGRNTISQERRLRGSLDKKRKRIKKDLEEMRLLLDAEMNGGRQTQMRLAKIQVKIGDQRRTFERARAKRNESNGHLRFLVNKREEMHKRVQALEKMLENMKSPTLTEEFLLNNENRELERMQKVLEESEKEQVDAVGEAERSKVQLDVIHKEKSKLEHDLYVIKSGRRFSERKRRIEEGPPAEQPSKKRRKSLPIRSPAL